jgi:hypothetical protein
VAVERVGDRLDRARRDLVAGADQVGQLADHGAAHADRLLGPVQRQHVAAQVDLAVEMVLERLHDQVPWTGQLGGHLVRKLELNTRH